MARVFRARRTSDTVKIIGFVAVVIVLVILVYAWMGNLSNTQQEKQLEFARDAIIKAAVQCYAMESQYPPSLQYLVDNYGLTLDEKKYVYHYRAIGSNMTPEIKVFPNAPRGGGR